MLTLLADITLAAAIMLLFWLIGKGIKRLFPLLKRYYIPSALLAGTLGLILIAAPITWLNLIPESVIETWSGWPGLLINVVFACLFLGKRILSARETWRLAGPQVVFGQTLAWGQYVVGLLLTLLVLVPVFNMSPLAGALIEISFEGGHGTAAGLAPVFEELGFAEGADLAIGLATIGIVIGIITGVLLVNWGHRTNKTIIKAPAKSNKQADVTTDNETTHLDDNAHEEPSHWLDRLPWLNYLLHAGYIAVAIALGQILLNGLIQLEQATWARDGGLELMASMPLFPLAMLGGVIVQYVLTKLNQQQLIDRAIINRFGSLALDVLIIAAIATMSLQVLGDFLVPFLLIALVGISWNIFAFLVIAPRMIPKYWFERGIGDYGQSMGMTATGLLLMRITDPKNSSRALESFGYKQLFFEPIVGGGIFTASSIILIHQFGALNMLGVTAAVMVSWIIFGYFQFHRS